MIGCSVCTTRGTYALLERRGDLPNPARLLQHRLDGRVVEVKRAVPREEALRTRQSAASRLDTRKVFIGGLAATVTEADFRTYFEAFGPIIDAIVMIDRDTNRYVGTAARVGDLPAPYVKDAWRGLRRCLACAHTAVSTTIFVVGPLQGQLSWIRIRDVRVGRSCHGLTSCEPACPP